MERVAIGISTMTDEKQTDSGDETPKQPPPDPTKVRPTKPGRDERGTTPDAEERGGK
jgi:hypothetical protein